MFQQITPAFSSRQWVGFFSKPNLTARFLLLFVASAWLFALNASTVSNSIDGMNSATEMAGDTIITASICANESYVFDGQILNTTGEYVATYIGSDGADSVVTLQLTVLPLSLTNLNETICEGQTFSFNGQDLNQSGTYSVTLISENGCDSIVNLQLNVLQPSKTDLNATICVDSFFVFQGDTLTQSGVYSIVLVSSEGCDSIVTLTLKVVTFFDVQISATICAEDSYTFGDTVYTDAGVYVYVQPTASECDSVITLTLTVRPAISTNLSVTLCEGSEYDFLGDILTVEGIYEAVLTAENGCDSTIVLDLNFVDFYETNIEGTICTGGVYVFDTDLLSAEGTYVRDYVAVGGCDSTVTLVLTVLPVSFGTEQATICAEGSYEYQGEVLTDQGDYTFILEAANGCDSTVTFTLNVLPAIATAIQASICDYETYAFGGELLNDAGTYEAILTAENGCDSVVTLTLNVLPSQQTDLVAEICEGDAYNYLGALLTDAGSYTFVFIGANGCDSTVNLVLTVNQAQSVTVNANICDGESYEFDGVLISDAGTYTAVFTGANGCDSAVVLVLEVLPVQNASIEATICSNETYDFNGGSLSDPGIYTAVLTGENGCDSTVVLSLTVLPTQSTLISATICDGDSYDYNGFILTTSGNFEYGFEGENGCDSTVTVALTVLPVAKTLIEATICDGDIYDYNGDTLTLEGDYDYVFDAFNGCDSIVTIALTVLPLSSSTTIARLCEGSKYVFNGDTLTSSGIYSYFFTGANGCDSTATLVLDFVSFFETDLQASICSGESYVFGNDTLTQSGDFNLTLIAQGGCDSIINLALNVLPLNASTTDASICEGETYSFNGLDLNTGGTYSATLTGANGCDSTAVLNLTVLPLLNSSIEATICSNESYDFNGLTLSDAGTYTAVMTGENGCDSTIVLTLSVLPVQNSSLSASVCANQSYDFNGLSLSVAGVYTAVLQGENGCDSIVTLTLEVLPLAQSAFSASVCNGEPFEYNGEVLTQSGEYQFIYVGAAANGCDSVETLFLTIFPLIPTTNITAAICDGDTYDFYGTILTTAGLYTEDLASSVGCDSTIVLILAVYHNPVTNLSATICEGESYPFNGQILTVAGIYTVNLVSAAGCDSTVNLALAVITVNTNVSVQGNTITAQAANATYQWIDCANNQPIQGATGSSFTPATTGNYAVVVTQNGCTATSTCVFVQIVSANEPLGGAAWALQPNPASSYTQVVFSVEADEDLSLEVLDLAGRSLHRQIVAPGTRQIELKLNALPDGILIVRLANKNGVSTKRLVKGQH